MSTKEKTETVNTKTFNKLFDELGDCDEEEQRQKIEEMKGVIDGMNEEEFKSVFTKELFDKICRMFEEKKSHSESMILLLKHVGFNNVLKYVSIYSFEESSLRGGIKEMIDEENDEGKNEKRLADLCECYLSLKYEYMDLPETVTEISVRCLLKVALSKEENEETQKEAEMALLALSCIESHNSVKNELYLNEIKEIIQHHQEHHNLTRLAYQSAWRFLVNRLRNNKGLEDLIVNKLHFIKEAINELEYPTKYLDGKGKEERRKETEEALVIWRWFDIIDYFFSLCKLWNRELVGVFGSMVRVFRSSRDNHKEICNGCLYSLRRAAEKRNMEIDAFVKEGAVDLFLEEMKQSTLDDYFIGESLNFFLNISERLKEKTDGETDETKRKELKRKIFERMEEEGYEDVIVGFHDIVSFLYKRYNAGLSLNIYDYFVNA